MHYAGEAAAMGTAAKTCPTTQLKLVPSHSQNVWRVARASFGAMNPQERDTAADRTSWGRWDVAGGRTIYAASDRLGAFLESMAWAEPADLGKVGDVLDQDTKPRQSYKDAIAQEWADRQHMPQASLPAGWREALRVYPLRLPPDGWFVDIADSASIATLNHAPELIGLVDPGSHATQGSGKITLEHLTGIDRTITTAIAEWVYDQTLEDGRLAHGIDYGSKWGTDLRCYAIWLRRLADGADPSSEPTTRRHPTLGQEIDEWDPDFRKAAQMLGITPH